MKVLALVFIVCTTGVFGECDKSKCPLVPIHYENLGCKPVLDSDNCCARSFDCSHLDARVNGKCYYKNKVFEANSAVDDDVLKGTCIGAAHCTSTGNFIHAHLDCAEFFGPPLGPDCIRQYSSDKCCSTGPVCGDTAKALKTCQFEGKSYKTGERMYPDSDSCYTCYCTDNFNSNLPLAENPNCKKAECKLDLLYADKIKEKCAPVYHKDSCCSSNFRCPSESDAVAENTNKNTTGPKCKFGKLELSIGDSLTATENKCQKCTCSIPPFVTCSFVDC